MTVLERAGSRFAGWLFCLFLCSEPDNGGQQRQEDGKSIKRKRGMTINTQPKFVSPMRFDSCDDEYENEKHLSPLPPLPRLQRDKTMSTGSSISASFSFNRKSTIGPRPSTIRISAPSDFRRVQSMTTFPPPQSQSQPQPKEPNHFLELSIYKNPRHALPDLPSFDNFHVNIGDSESPIKRPQRVFSSPPDSSFPPAISRVSVRNTGGSLSGFASFRLPRKPVGTAPGPRRSSTAAGASWPTARPKRQRFSTPSSPLIPHFARVQRGSMDRPVPRSLSMGMSSALDGDFAFTLQDRTALETSDDDYVANANLTPPILPSPTLRAPQSQSQSRNKPLPLPPSQSQPGTEHARSWSGSTLASSTYTCTYNPTPPKGFDVSVISRPGSRTGLGQGAGANGVSVSSTDYS